MPKLPVIKNVNKPKFVLPSERQKKPSLLARLFVNRAANFVPHIQRGVISRAALKASQNAMKLKKTSFPTKHKVHK